jgi:negative regulator of sigma E activity
MLLKSNFLKYATVINLQIREVQQSLNGINALFTRWKELLETSNTAGNEEFNWTNNELKNGLRSIEWDVSDLEETISMYHFKHSCKL